MSKELNKALDLLREIRPSIPKDVLELWCKDRDAFLASHKAPAEQAEPERPEVVARVVHSNPVVLGQCGPLNANDELMTVAQHAASVARWAEMFNRVEQERDAANARLHEVATACATAEQERDAALAEVERLRESKGDPSGSFDRCMKMMYERDENAKRLDAALA
ncbi:hypothetical protein ACM7JE_29995, partial [Pseudomonas aeruginosa]